MCLTSVICLEGRTDQEDHLGNWFCDNDSLTVLICQTTSGQNRWVSGQTRCAKAEEGKEQNPTTRTEQVDRRADRQTVSEKTSRETRKRRMPHRDKPKQTRPKERPRCRAGLGFGVFFFIPFWKEQQHRQVHRCVVAKRGPPRPQQQQQQEPQYQQG